MKLRYWLVALVFLTLLSFEVSAATLFVSLTSTNPVPPYANWPTAATNIQDAIDASTNGDLILVTNGVYQTGGRAVNGYALTNRLAVTNAVTVQSVNGPAATIIEGHQVPGTITGDGAVRCVYLASSAVLSGFTLTNGATRGAAGDPKGEQVGGGAYCSTASSVISNCVLTGNAAYFWGGGAIYGSLNKCVIENNTAGSGGGTYLAKLYNCVVVGNAASGSGGGATRGTLNNCTVCSNSAVSYGGGFDGSSDGTLNNCIVYFNSAPTNANYFRGSFNPNGSINYCCTIPYSTNGPGNITNDPAFVNAAAGDFHLQSNSPCLNAGNNGYVTGATDLDGNARIVNGVVDMGAYEYQGNVRYVSLTSTNPIAPYSDWSIAATNIQDAIDAASEGDLVLVTNGVYAVGGRPVNGNALTNRVALTKPLSVQSVNGPAVTVIQGYQMPGTTNGDSAVRCVYMTNGTSLFGFTLTGGATRAIANGMADGNGGGIWCESLSAFVTNCAIIGNNSGYGGGGAFAGTFANCILSNNAVLGGRDWGGGAWNSAMTQCIIVNNRAGMGGGAFQSQLNDCLVLSNAAIYGGGVNSCGLVNCTVVGNTASDSGGGIEGGSIGPFATNSIIYYNNSPTGPNWSSGVGYNDVNCCSYPLLGGPGNITNLPMFVNLTGGDIHLQSNSPCINSGNNACITSTTDLDGNPRIVGGTVDIGAYEYQTPTSVISYAWLQQYGLPTDGSVDYADLDGTGFNVYQDWIAGLNPTNALSVLAMLPPVPENSPAGLAVSWESVSNRTYFLQSSTNLTAQPAFSTLQSNIVGQAGTTSYLDTNAVGKGPFFYRVGVQH
jgi:hypothetical protein